MASFGYGGSVRMNPEVEKENFDPMFEEGYPLAMPRVYLNGSGEAYFPQYSFSWSDDSVVMVRDRHVVKYTRSSFVELLAKNEEGEIVWMDGRRAPYSDCWGGEYLNETRPADEYTITEYDLDGMKIRKYKVSLEEETCMDNWDLRLLSCYDVKETIDSRFEIKDGVLLQYLGTNKDITIPDNVIEIGVNAFKSCDKFNSIKIPKTVTKISFVGNFGCPAAHLEVDKDNSKYYTKDGLLIDRDEKELIWAYSGSDIPNDGSVVKIGSKAFYGRSDLSKIVIPDVITEIGDNAFASCGILEEIVAPDRVIDDAKRIFGVTLQKDDDKWRLGGRFFGGFSF